jgi:nitric oxide synthase oxygenase domain/subunit
MKISFSRHAKRRAKLYKIPETVILEILGNMELSHGKHEIIKKVDGHKFSLKIVVDIKNDILTIVTNYPLRRGRKK